MKDNFSIAFKLILMRDLEFLYFILVGFSLLAIFLKNDSRALKLLLVSAILHVLQVIIKEILTKEIYETYEDDE